MVSIFRWHCICMPLKQHIYRQDNSVRVLSCFDMVWYASYKDETVSRPPYLYIGHILYTSYPFLKFCATSNMRWVYVILNPSAVLLYIMFLYSPVLTDPPRCALRLVKEEWMSNVFQQCVEYSSHFMMKFSNSHTDTVISHVNYIHVESHNEHNNHGYFSQTTNLTLKTPRKICQLLCELPYDLSYTDSWI